MLLVDTIVVVCMHVSVCVFAPCRQILQVVTQLELARYKLYMQIQFARSHKNLQGRWGALHLPEVLPSISELHSPRLISS